MLPLLLLPLLFSSPQQTPPVSARHFVSIQGPRKLWHPLAFTFATSISTSESTHPANRNPFLDYRLRLTFRHLDSGAERVVNGFYSADGDPADSSAASGPCWSAFFSPDLAGAWKWSAEFRRAPGIALSPTTSGTSADPRVDGAFGTFTIAPADPAAPGFYSRGRLEYVDDFYFRTAETDEPFLKSGAGGPENFLAYFEFDGTSGDPQSLCLAAPEHLHHYQPHAADFLGDALDLAHTWGTPEKGANILGAIDYLASVGVNGIYFITNTDQGDGRDVWPWVTPADKRHFDVSKLAQWERVLAHMNARGLQFQFVLEEHENDQIPVSGGGLGLGLTPERRLYYREMVARFAHLPALMWVIGDESDYFDEIATMESMASEIRSLDPYRHPIAFHSKHPCFGASCPEPYPSVFDQYSPYFGFGAFEASAFQTAPGGYNSSTVAMRTSQASTRRWVHCGDEQSLNATAPNLDQNRSKALWGNLMGGGAGVAWYPGNAAAAQYPPGVDFCDYFDLGLEDFRRLESYFVQTRVAIDLFQARLPFTEMVPDNALATTFGSTDYVFLRPENAGLGVLAVYAVYRGTGSATGLTIGSGTHTVEWFDPRTGAGPIADLPLVGPGVATLTPPSSGVDWLAIVRQQ